MPGADITRVLARRVLSHAGKGTSATWLVTLDGQRRWDIGAAGGQAEAQTIAARLAAALGKIVGLDGV